MVPYKPGKTGAVGAEPRTRVEVIALDEDTLTAFAARIYSDNCIDDAILTPGVIFAHANNYVADGVVNAVGMAQLGDRRERVRSLSTLAETLTI
jgi:hypothetical protein